MVSARADEGGAAACNVSARAVDTAKADAVRCALLAHGLDATQSFVQAAGAGATIRDSIVEVAKRWGADLVLTDDPVAAHLVDVTAFDVLYLPGDSWHRSHVPPRRVFVACDDSPSALRAVETAKQVAGAGELRRAFVSREAQENATLDSATVVLMAAHHANNLPHAILQAAHEWGADLLVLGAHGPIPHSRWRYGSVASAVAQIADMPLLLVPERE
ncbi:universal stress protein [Paraburkholderia azotifigens]